MTILGDIGGVCREAMGKVGVKYPTGTAGPDAGTGREVRRGENNGRGEATAYVGCTDSPAAGALTIILGDAGGPGDGLGVKDPPAYEVVFEGNEGV